LETLKADTHVPGRPLKAAAGFSPAADPGTGLDGIGPVTNQSGSKDLPHPRAWENELFVFVVWWRSALS
jgi:hypothetical protein